jgi:hypothetical protein
MQHPPSQWQSSESPPFYLKRPSTTAQGGAALVSEDEGPSHVLQRLEQRLSNRWDPFRLPEDFYLIESLSRCASAFDAKELESLEDCRQNMKKNFHGAVFLWQGRAGEAPRHHVYPQGPDAPDFTMLSWNILCHRYIGT